MTLGKRCVVGLGGKYLDESVLHKGLERAR